MSHPARASLSRLASLAAAVSLVGLSACAFGSYDPVARTDLLVSEGTGAPARVLVLVDADTGDLMPDLCSYTLACFEFLQMDL